jgi:hypothetical protein
VARGDELRRNPWAAGGVRAGEQQVRLLDAAVARVRGGSREARRGIWLPGRVGGRERRRGGLRGRACRGRKGAPWRGTDADRVPHDAHARARRPRRHELRAEGAAGGVARARPDRALRRAAVQPAPFLRAGDRGDPPRGRDGGGGVGAQGARLADAGSRAGHAGRVRGRMGAARRRGGARRPPPPRAPAR